MLFCFVFSSVSGWLLVNPLLRPAVPAVSGGRVLVSGHFLKNFCCQLFFSLFFFSHSRERQAIAQSLLVNDSCFFALFFSSVSSWLLVSPLRWCNHASKCISWRLIVFLNLFCCWLLLSLVFVSLIACLFLLTSFFESIDFLFISVVIAYLLCLIVDFLSLSFLFFFCSYGNTNIPIIFV